VLFTPLRLLHGGEHLAQQIRFSHSQVIERVGHTPAKEAFFVGTNILSHAVPTTGVSLEPVVSIARFQKTFCQKPLGTSVAFGLLSPLETVRMHGE
jgi:hypothetical protein